MKKYKKRKWYSASGLSGISGGIRRFLCFLTAFVLILETGMSCKALEDADLYAQSAVLIDGESGKVLYGKQAQVPMANASTTKIMTCILVLENCEFSEETGVSGYAASMPKVKLYMKQGEHYLVEDLLYSLMLESHNDSAVALGEHVGKKWIEELKDKPEEDFTMEDSERALKAFSVKMNQKAEEIGCEDTYFITPNGLDATERVFLSDGSQLEQVHHTTAKDLAQILSYCILRSPRRESFLEVTGRDRYSFSANGRTFSCANHNSFLHMMDGVVSGKTGFTGKAGYCYVGALKSNDRYFVAAVLACGWPNNKSYKWADTRKLMEYGMEGFRRVDLVSQEILYPEEELPRLLVSGGQGEGPGMVPEVDLIIDGREDLPESRGILLGKEEKVQVCVALKKELTAPVKKGEKVGEIRYVVGEEVYRREEILTAEAVDKIDMRWCISQVLHRYLGGGGK